MARKKRGDTLIKNLEKDLGLGSSAITNPDGSNARGDKKLGTLRADYEKTQKNKKVGSNSATSHKVTKAKKLNPTSRAKSISKKTASAVAKTALKTSTQSKKKSDAASKFQVTVTVRDLTADQRKASRRVVKSNPKTNAELAKVIKDAILKNMSK